jgi:hypothetical protein
MKRSSVIGILVVASIFLLATNALAMPSAKISQGEKIVGVSVVNLRDSISYTVYGQSAVTPDWAVGFTAGKLPAIGPKDGLSGIGGYLNYSFFKGGDTTPDASIQFGLGYASGDDYSATFPVFGILLSQDLGKGISYSLVFSPSLAYEERPWGISGQVSYKLDELANTTGVALQLGYTYVGGLSAGATGSLNCGVSYSFK